MPRLLPIVALVAGSLLLAGCTPEPEPTPTATATVEPSPTAEAAVRPNPVFDLTCAELLALDEAQAAVTAPITVKRDETGLPGELLDVAYLQRGGLSCRWGGDARTDSSFDDGIDVLLLPDAESDYLLRADGLAETWSVAGADAAIATCGAASDAVDGTFPGYCVAAARVGTTLVELRFSDSQGAYGTEAELATVGQSLLATVIERLRAADSVDQRWTAPNSAAATGDLCANLGAAFLSTVGVGGLTGGAVDAFVAGSSACTYQNALGAFPANVVGVTALHGGAWAAGVTHTESPALGQPWEERRTAAGALWWLSPNGESVQGRAAIGGDLVTVSFLPQEAGQSVEQAQAAITAFMEQYAEAPPGT